MFRFLNLWVDMWLGLLGRSDRKYMSPDTIRRHYGDEAGDIALERCRDRGECP